jgi:hypothetical protein
MDEAQGAPAPSSGGGLIEVLTRFIEEVFGASTSLMEVYADRLRQSVRRKLIGVAIGACAAIFAGFWLAASALAILRGICAGIAALSGGREWFGDLLGGSLALAIAIGAVALGLRMSSSRELRRLETKYERIRDDRIQDPARAPSADDGEGAARPRGGRGEGEDRVRSPAAG